jgi:hypothetical protein
VRHPTKKFNPAGIWVIVISGASQGRVAMVLKEQAGGVLQLQTRHYHGPIVQFTALKHECLMIQLQSIPEMAPGECDKDPAAKARTKKRLSVAKEALKSFEVPKVKKTRRGSKKAEEQKA